MGCFVRGDKNSMGCFVRGDKNSMGCFVRGGKSLWDVSSGVSKNGIGCFVPGCFVRLPAVTPVRLVPPVPQSQVKHSTIEPLRSLIHAYWPAAV